MWIIEALQGITATHALLMILPFLIGEMSAEETASADAATSKITELEGKVTTLTKDVETARAGAGTFSWMQ